MNLRAHTARACVRACVSEKITEDTRLSDAMESAFRVVAHMLTGKRFPRNF